MMRKSFAGKSSRTNSPHAQAHRPRQYNQPHAATSAFALKSRHQPSLASPSRIKQAKSIVQYVFERYRSVVIIASSIGTSWSGHMQTEGSIFPPRGRNALGLSVLAYNLGDLWRRLALPKGIENWSLTSLQQRLVKTGRRLVKHARYYWLLLAESHLTKRLFGNMLRRIAGLSLAAG